MQSLIQQAAAERRSGHPDRAEAIYRSWLRIEPTSAAARYGLSLLLLAREAYLEAWPLWEARSELPNVGVKKPTLSFPQWRGEPVKSLLIWPEQGLGDQIMFARYVPELIGLGINVTVLCSPSLVRLFEPLGAEVIGAQGAMSIPQRDAWCLVGSLPGILGGTPPAIYLPHAPGGEGVGVVARGNAKPDPGRSLPSPEAEALLAMGRDLLPEATGARDFRDTAEIVSALDLVITIDTSVVHLAGSLGKRTWVLLPHDGDWRWGYEPERCNWYPAMRLFRQQEPGDWSSVLREVGAQLDSATRTTISSPDAPAAFAAPPPPP